MTRAQEDDVATQLTTTTPAQSRESPRKRTLQGFNPRTVINTYGTVIALVLAVVVFAVINPSFLTPSNVATILDQAAVPMILAMGMTFVILMGCIDLSVEGVMATSGLTFVLLSPNTSNSNAFVVLAIMAALALGACFGVVAGVLHTWLRVPTFIATLGLWYVGLGVATLEYGDAVTELQDSFLVTHISARPLGITNSTVLAIVVVALALFIARWTRIGRNAYAIGENEDIAALSGVAVNRFKTYVFALSGLGAALAGIVGSLRLGAGVVEVGSGQVFFTVAAVVVGGTLLSGGRGGIGRSVIGVLLLTVINNGLVLAGVTPNIQQALFGAIIICAVVATAYHSRGRLKVVK